MRNDYLSPGTGIYYSFNSINGISSFSNISRDSTHDPFPNVAGVVQISPLLAPALDQPPEFGPSTVPRDRQDLFARLVGLLSFETHPQDTVSYNMHCRGILTCNK